MYGCSGLMGLGSQVPESFVMMVAPSSCGIHSSVSIMEKDYRGNNAYLILTESEVSMGEIESNIYESVDKILSRRKVRPKV